MLGGAGGGGGEETLFHELKISGRQNIEKRQERPGGQPLDSSYQMLLREGQLDYSDK